MSKQNQLIRRKQPLTPALCVSLLIWLWLAVCIPFLFVFSLTTMALGLLDPVEGVFYLLLSVVLGWAFSSTLVGIPLGFWIWRNYSQENLRKIDFAATRVVGLWKRLPLRKDPMYATILSTLAFARSCLGRNDEACKLYYDALGLTKKYKRMAYPHVATILNNIAGIHARENNFEEADRLLDQSLEIWQKQKGGEANGAAIPLTNKGHVLIGQGHLDEAEQVLLKAKAMFEEPLQPQRIVRDTCRQSRVICLLELIDLSCQKRQPEQARAFVDEALNVISSIQIPPGPQMLRTLNSASARLLEAGEVDCCTKLVAIAYEIGRLFPDHPDAHGTLGVFEQLLEKTSRRAEISDMKRWLLPV